MLSSRPPWWRADIHADRRPRLLARGRITRAVRDWFEARGFIEVETGALVVSPGNETHLHAFSTDLQRPDGTRRRLHLHTSPEFACKKLLAAGEREIFTLARVWRNRERGALHAPEFTMLEWYRAEAPWTAVADDALDLLRLAAETAGVARFTWRGRACDPFADAERITVAEAFDRWAGVDLLATVDTETDDAKRADAAKKADDLLAADMVTLPLDPLPNLGFYGDKITGDFSINVIAGPWWNIATWSVKS